MNYNCSPTRNMNKSKKRSILNKKKPNKNKQTQSKSVSIANWDVRQAHRGLFNESKYRVYPQ